MPVNPFQVKIRVEKNGGMHMIIVMIVMVILMDTLQVVMLPIIGIMMNLVLHKVLVEPVDVRDLW
jgi:hypothetical protein